MLSCVWLCHPMDCSTPGLPVHHQLPEFTQTHVQSRWCHPTVSSPSLAFNLSQHQGLFQWVSSSHQAAKVLEFQHQSFCEFSGLISFRMDWLDLLAVQGTLKSLLQHHSSKASNLQPSAFFILQLSHPYMTTGKTIALTRWTFVDKGISLLSNMLSRLVISFLPRSKCLLISCALVPLWEETSQFFPPCSPCEEVQSANQERSPYWKQPLPDLRSWTVSLWNCEKNKFLLFKPPSIWYFFMTAWDDRYKP